MIAKWLRELPTEKLSQGQVFHLYKCAFLLPVVMILVVANLDGYAAFLKSSATLLYMSFVIGDRRRA